MKHLDALIHSRQLVITAGTGGVGKTTLSAALALRAAQLGKRAVVITVDPAKRLAQSLGLEKLGDDPVDLTAAAKAIGPCAGTLAAVIPDTRRTFEAFVKALSSNPKVHDRVIQNPIFSIFAKEYSGTNEYMALKRLDALHEQGRFDFIVLDTPPSRNTLAFLDAPGLLARFFDDKIIGWLVTPANRLFSAGMRKVMDILESLTGQGFITHLIEFSTALFEVRLPFAENMKRVIRLLQSDTCGVLLVTVPALETVPDTRRFLETTRERGLRFDGMVLNRTMTALPVSESERSDPGLAPALKLVEALGFQEKRVLQGLESCLNEADDSAPFILRLPQFVRDVHSLKDLDQVARLLGGGAAGPSVDAAGAHTSPR